jgi:hypothetical protein
MWNPEMTFDRLERSLEPGGEGLGKYATGELRIELLPKMSEDSRTLLRPSLLTDQSPRNPQK